MFNPEDYKNVFQPIRVGNVILKNRLQFSPMVNPMTTSTGEVTDNYVDFIDMEAATGVGLVTIGATGVDTETGEDFAGELDVTDDNKMISLRRLPEVAHAHGAKLSIELVHGGRGANPAMLKKPDALAPTPIPTSWGSPYIKSMDRRDMDYVRDCYADVVKRLRACDFDMVMIHAAHGNLLAQFLSPATNHRLDFYGGSQENRFRYPLEVLAAVREAAGPKMAIEMRISGDELVEGGMRIEETIEFLKQAQKYIDLVHVSGGWVVDPTTMYTTMPPYFTPRGSFIQYAEAVKKCTDIHIPVATVGGIDTLEMAEKIIGSGQADIVAMARALLADPDMIKKSYAGKPETARPCLRCWCCAGSFHHIRCAVNPSLGRTGVYREVAPARIKKKCVVIGGGPAGMTAAQTLIERGHDVVLYEKSDTLGGRLNEINQLPFKADMRKYTEWMIRTTMSCGAKINLHTTATPELVSADSPDAVLVAVGAGFFTPPISGADGPNVVSVVDVDGGKVKTGHKVVVCGGGASGVECGLALAMEGKDVTVVDMIPEECFASGVEEIPRWEIQYKFMKEYDLKFLGGSRVVAITDKGVEVEDHNWRNTFLEANTVVNAFGMKPRSSLVQQFAKLAPEVYVIGDCEHVESIKSANHAAFNYCVHI